MTPPPRHYMTCLYCFEPLASDRTTGRPPVYCSTAHRRADWKRRQRQAAKALRLETEGTAAESVRRMVKERMAAQDADPRALRPIPTGLTLADAMTPEQLVALGYLPKEIR